MNNLKFISDDLETATVRCLHENCPSDTKALLGLRLIEVEDAVVSLSENDPSILINRVVGLGSRQPVDKNTVLKILDIYAEHDVKSFFLHLYEDDLIFDKEELLSSCGLRKARGWMKFYQDTRSPLPASSNLRIEKVTGQSALDFGKIACSAFDLTDEAIPMVAALANDDHFNMYLSYEGETPAGTGALFVDGENGWLDWGATAPSFRRRGGQALVMAARIQKAVDLGCKNLFTETGEEVEGDPQHSYKNILKAGFKELHVRSNYVLA